jgi:hypothetical protein
VTVETKLRANIAEVERAIATLLDHFDVPADQWPEWVTDEWCSLHSFKQGLEWALHGGDPHSITAAGVLLANRLAAARAGQA